MRKIIFCFVVLLSSISIAQTAQDSISSDPNQQINGVQRLLSGNFGKAVTLGSYAELTYTQAESENAELDIPRLVVLVGYKFDERTQFVAEIEFEHIKELAVEQAFVNYALTDNVNLRGGLMLIPMGIINEYHEPTTFNGTLRPGLDTQIIPSTWRELGVGVSGRFPNISLGYQAYVFNGLKSVTADGSNIEGLLLGDNGIRNGRQSAAKSTLNTPTFSAKLDYYGLPGIRLGLSGYYGNSQAEDEIEEIDGATIGITMVALDARYAFRRFTARGEFVYGSLADTNQYNILTGEDLGSAMMGFYVEGAYNLLPLRAKQRLFAFARYEKYDTHAATEGDLLRNDVYNRQDITTGLSYHIANGVVLKGDYQFRTNAVDGGNVRDQLNFGIGAWF